MADEELGTKRVCPDTGKKFYDLGKNPIVSPYTGKSYPLSFFETVAASAKKSAVIHDDEDEEDIEIEEEVDGDGPVLVSLEEIDEEGADDEEADQEEIPDLPDVDVDLGDDDEVDDDTFLDDEDEDDDLSDMINSPDGEEEV